MNAVDISRGYVDAPIENHVDIVAEIKRMKEESKKFNSKIANRIVKMEEVFSLVCEKVNIKERIKKRIV